MIRNKTIHRLKIDKLLKKEIVNLEQTVKKHSDIEILEKENLQNLID